MTKTQASSSNLNHQNILTLNDFKDEWDHYITEIYVFAPREEKECLYKAVDHVYREMNMSTSESVNYLRRFTESLHENGDPTHSLVLKHSLELAIHINKEQYMKNERIEEKEEEAPPPDYQEAIKPHTTLLQERDKAFSEVHVLQMKLKAIEEKQREIISDLDRAVTSNKHLESDNKHLRDVNRSYNLQIGQLRHLANNYNKPLLRSNSAQGHILTDRIVGAPYQEWTGPGLL